ncbi:MULTISPECIES: GNAT family N-acetyltransferase [Anaerococcus]|uniref:GNAT family N-acetyltransferase n=1 Tax=Anaerococcus TaxID=165779 RepID=UPI0015F33DE2|nr:MULTISPECIES: GNAT family N-acetyltransferase [Anaerococcus]MBP2069572.1 GNAT superfamily N-acetyltransferase [Anaerococcus nagyae]MDU1828825.1 GNAT family N-acetyltransferase [Anaerococcus sp.]MDU1864117.1 GNAT family N-acetyltransferase [Anaerococcus sp.]MDU2353570.1 GNAT family N-acetyltransferase [Anaerococcus sp.]MDU2565424.1 GNAT family N-acetyltransferase [Anaerococcus sp.]
MDLLDISKASGKQYFETLYIKSFPEDERIDLADLYSLKEDGLIDIVNISDDNRDIGFAVIYFSDNVHLLSYFAIEPDLRSKGLGSKSLSLLKNTYKDLMIEIESTDLKDSDDYHLRNRRKAFYIRNGFKVLEDKVDYFGIEMELMSTTKDAGINDYFDTYNNIFDKEFIDENIKLISI